MQNDYEKRYLAQHNASPSHSAHTSPMTTPTKNRTGDRFIPVRLPTADSQLRFNSIRDEQSPRNRSGLGGLTSGKGWNNMMSWHGRSPVSGLSFSGGNSGGASGSGSNQMSSNGSNSSPSNSGGGGNGNSNNNNTNNNNSTTGSNSSHHQQDEAHDLRAHRALLRNELLNAQIEDVRMEPTSSNGCPIRLSPNSRKVSINSSFDGSPGAENESPGGSIAGTSLFRFGRPGRSPAKRVLTFVTEEDKAIDNRTKLNSSLLPTPSSIALPSSIVETMQSNVKLVDVKSNPLKNVLESRIDSSVFLSPYALTPLSSNSQRLLRSPRKPCRKIPRNPYKVLDAPDLQDDFYLNLIDWSSQNILAVGLGSCVYLWNAWNSNVQKLCDLSEEEDSVTSVEWNGKGDLIAVGTGKGLVGVWDPTTVTANGGGTRIINMPGHTSRVGCLSWNSELLCSGSRDRYILQRDIRTPPQVTERKLTAHKQEVCGMKWSPDFNLMASGGNDNQLLIWTLHSPNPVQTYTEHVAAVKALAWSPHHHGLLVSGGGTADRTMRFWNTLTGQAMQSHDTGSQVCNIAWSKHSNELVSTHGYSQNQIVIWKYPSLKQVTRLTGHTFRVLYLAMSPEGESIVTGAGDETLRFWQVFSKHPSFKDTRSKLSLSTGIR